jgi:hypothetical protein
MTLALGIVCDCGVVLGVDTQISVGGGKIPGPKIQLFWEALPDYNVVSCSYGHADSIETAREEIAEALEKLKGTRPVVREIRKSVSEALERVYIRHIDCLPTADDRAFMDFTLLLAIRVGRTARLFRTNRAQVVEQRSRWCMGSGKEFADYVFDLFLESHPTTEIAAQVAAYVIGITKEHIEGVGHSTDVHVIESDGHHWSLHAPQVEEIESGFAKFFETLRHAIGRIDSRFTSDNSLPTWFGFLGDNIKELRAAQDKRMELRARMREGRLDPQSPKDDPSPPPPSPESPGGPNES